MNLVTWLESLAGDARFGVRLLARSPGFALVAAGSLALGVGGTAAAFSFADGLLLRPLPVPDPRGVVAIGSTTPDQPFGGLSHPDFAAIRRDARSFSGLTAWTTIPVAVGLKGDEPPRVRNAVAADGRFFEVLGVRPAPGRGFRPAEDEVPGRDPVVVVSHRFWTEQLAADPEVLGQALRINGIDFVVIGVAPEPLRRLERGQNPALFVPLAMWPRLAGDPECLERRDLRALRVRGRLGDGVDPATADAEVATLAEGLAAAWPETHRGVGAIVRSDLQARLLGSPPDAILSTLLALLALTVLLVASANVAGLLLSRATVRNREMAVRLAIGAGRVRLMRQLLVESLLLAGVGGAMGLLVARGGIGFLSGIQPPTDSPAPPLFVLDERVLLAALSASVVGALLFGLTPALQATRTDLVSGLKDDGTERGTRRRLTGRSALVLLQLAGSVVLLTIALVVYLGFRGPFSASPGFRTEGILMAGLDPTLLGRSEERTRRFYEALLERARTLPGVRAVALASGPPVGAGIETLSAVPDDYELPPGRERLSLLSSTISAGYVETLGVRLVEGRAFERTDGAAAPRVALVNAALADELWPGRSALGKRLRLGGANGEAVEIVGVTETGKYLWIGEPPTGFVYLPAAQRPVRGMTLFVRTSGPPAELAEALRGAVSGLDPDQPLFAVRTLEEYYRREVIGIPNTIVQTIAGLGAMGLLLAMVGLYALVSFVVSRRTREIGIRMALGATRSEVVGMVLRQGMVLSLAGAGAGLLAGIAVRRSLLEAFAPGTEGWTFLLLPPALCFVALLAAWVPARRAALVDPQTALRCD